jgi:hypothetical protein
VSHLFVPQYEDLTIDKITRWLSGKDACFAYYPIAKEITKLPKQWIVNVANTVLGAPFKQWIKQAIEDRNLKVAIQKDLNIGLDPEVAKCFKASTSVSRKSIPFRFVYLFSNK